MVRNFMFVCYVQVSHVGYSITLWQLGEWLEEKVLGAVCVCISCTGDGGQLGSSFLWRGRGGWGG